MFFTGNLKKNILLFSDSVNECTALALVDLAKFSLLISIYNIVLQNKYIQSIKDRISKYNGEYFEFKRHGNTGGKTGDLTDLDTFFFLFEYQQIKWGCFGFPKISTNYKGVRLTDGNSVTRPNSGLAHFLPVYK